MTLTFNKHQSAEQFATDFISFYIKIWEMEAACILSSYNARQTNKVRQARE